MTKQYLTTSELAKLLGISRVAVFNKIKEGKIKAVKIGRNFAIEKKDLSEILDVALGEKTKKNIAQAVKKVVNEYGETLKLLGRE